MGFFLTRYVKATDSLTKTVIKLDKSLGESITNQSNFKENCRDKHTTVDKRLDDHGDRLDKHAERITKLEAVK